MFDCRSKMIPALVHKNIDNILEINVYSFERHVNATTFRPPIELNLLEKVTHDVNRRIAKGAEIQRFISSVFIKPKLKVESHRTEFEVCRHPNKRVIYKSSVTLFRRFEIEPQPFVEIEIVGDDDDNNAESAECHGRLGFVWETTAYFEF